MIVHNRIFKIFIILCIVASGLYIAIQSPLVNPNSTLSSVLYWVDVATSVIYLIEFLMKIVTFGFILNGPKSYLRNKWNILDFCIVIFSVVSLIP